jgi:hypothetical protein
MNRDFYSFGIFFLTLYVIAALFQSMIFFQIGYQMLSLPSFATWALVLITTSLVGSLLMLNYFYHQGYKFAFITGVIAVFAGFCQSILPWLHLLLMLKQLESYHALAGVFSLSAGLLFAISLVFSSAGKNPYLKTMGIFILIMVGFSVYLMNLSSPAQSQLPNSIITQLGQWLTFVSSFESVPLIMLFYTPLRASKSPPESSSPYKFSGLLSGLGLIALMMLLVFGIRVQTQSYWSKHISAATKALTKPFENRSYINSEGDTLRYRLLKPTNYNPDKQYPMVVCLHGGAGIITEILKEICLPGCYPNPRTEKNILPFFLFPNAHQALPGEGIPLYLP